jgi:receptor protein-tyrosine kinase
VKSVRPYVVACLIAAALAGVVAIVYSLVAPDRYAAEMTVAVGEKNDVVSAELGDQTQAVANTVAQLMRSNVVARNVIATLKLDQSTSEFLDDVEIEQKPDAAVLTIKYEGDDKRTAVAALTQLEKAFQEQFAKTGADIKSRRDPETGEAQERLRVKVRVFDPPYALERKVSPRPLRNLAIAMLLGVMIAIFWTAFRESRKPSEETKPDGGKGSDDGGKS